MRGAHTQPASSLTLEGSRCTSGHKHRRLALGDDVWRQHASLPPSLNTHKHTETQTQEEWQGTNTDTVTSFGALAQ